MPNKLTEQIADIAAPLVALVLAQILEPVFRALIKKNPRDGRVFLASLYPVVDATLEPLAAKTGTGIDNCTIDAFKRSIEKVAAEQGIPLSNLDED